MNVSCGDTVPHVPQTLLAAALDAYIAIDVTGRVTSWNPAAEATFGYSRAQACGRLVEDLIIPQPDRPAHRARLARLAAGVPTRKMAERLRLFALHREGHAFPIDLTLTATDEPDGRLLHAFAHDVTAIHRASLFAAAESAVTRGLARADSSASAAASVVEALGVQMGWPVAELWLVDDHHRDVLRCEARHAEHPLGDFAIDEAKAGDGLPGQVFEQSETRWISDLAQRAGSQRSRDAVKVGLRMAAGVPICAHKRILGALCVYGDHPNDARDAKDAILVLLSGIAAQVGQFLDRRHAEELAVELARTKAEFVALVTHELRNPLSVITATASLAEEELDAGSPEDQREFLRTIARSAHRLSALAEDLLDLARLESGHLGVHPVPMDLSAIIGAAVQAATSAAPAEDVTVTVRTPRELPMIGDPLRLGQVADNLLSNAIKYTPAGGAVTVHADLDESGEQIIWSVADTGIGIPAAERPHLFRRFYRASTAVENRIPGTGMGLVITRTIIERHHGTIHLADGQGQGTTFVVRLPTRPPQHGEQRTLEQTAKG
ncbi:ATP-binding protein [Krasilnikovia sp. MM14-A1004]|uniref:ATP-binding protein n=1 Tax=Krasilnikovia sp. MM14-A1004 TaxID=3373541 RepID=UPI00399D077F